MKRCAELHADISCPACGAPSGLGRMLQFQWGQIPKIYHLGDAIVWLQNRSGQIVPSLQLVGPEGLWNSGDSSVRDLYVFDGDPNLREFACSRCGTIFETVAARIAEGVILGTVAFRPGEVGRLFGASPHIFDVAIARHDGSYEPRPDWYDPPFSEYKGQWP